MFFGANSFVQISRPREILTCNRAGAPYMHAANEQLQNRSEWVTGDYGVEVTAPGHFRSVNGFRTERDAQDWIEQQRANEAGAGRILQT